MKKVIALILTIVSIFSFSVFANANEIDESLYIPLWMEPNSVVKYDANANPIVLEGGFLSSEEIENNADIQEIGYVDPRPILLITPNIKVEYDQYGFMQNIYYLIPGTTSEYQLSNPNKPRADSGMHILDLGSYTYGRYKNPYTGEYQYNTLFVQDASPYPKIKGNGRITFFTGPYGDGDFTRPLRAYDCATLMYYDDVRAGTAVIAKNKDTNASCVFYKHDVGSLPQAILDIWSNDTINPITEITTSGGIDNVYNASIEHLAIPHANVDWTK